jgi:acetyl-CoA/propionyl-CoA carboxylase biotin carboxyl carrier protein
MSTFDRILVANRGEIAVRIIRTLRRLGISPVAVCSEADRADPHVALADIAVCLGPAPARDSYLRIERVVDAALSTGAQAVHPGYGFLSEQPAFARACDEAGLAFIGPPVEAIEAMADKIAAKRTVSAAGVPVVPGRLDVGLDDDALIAAAHEIGLPVLVKPSAGGGGKGMWLVRDAAELADAIAAARRSALGAFGDDTLFVERFVERPRHIEIQVLADGHGGIVHLGERECSLQRRHQKVVEESPSPFVTPEVRDALGAQAVRAARAVGYTSTGTVEFIMPGDRPDEFFFLEMNTRLQVEHPVTELRYDLDLVEWQIRVAAGEALPFAQDDLVPSGHAVEARVYAEQPARDFLPTGGTVVDVIVPTGAGVRIDSGIAAGTTVSSHYDPLLAKVIAHGATRDEALDRLAAALAGWSVIGVETNTAMLRALVRHPEVRAGALDTGLVERLLPELVQEPATPPPAALLAAALRDLAGASTDSDPWRACVGWRLGGRAWSTEQWESTAGTRHVVRLRPRPGSAEWDAQIGDGPPTTAQLHGADDGATAITVGDVTERVVVRVDGATTWVVIDGTPWGLRRHDPISDRLRPGRSGAHGLVRSPMPGTVRSVAEHGAAVAAGQLLAVVEAMKMEHHVRAPSDGRVTAVHVHVGQQVALDEPLLELEVASPCPDEPQKEADDP